MSGAGLVRKEGSGFAEADEPSEDEDPGAPRSRPKGPSDSDAAAGRSLAAVKQEQESDDDLYERWCCSRVLTLGYRSKTWLSRRCCCSKARTPRRRTCAPGFILVASTSTLGCQQPMANRPKKSIPTQPTLEQEGRGLCTPVRGMING